MLFKGTPHINRVHKAFDELRREQREVRNAGTNRMQNSEPEFEVEIWSWRYSTKKSEIRRGQCKFREYSSEPGEAGLDVAGVC